MNDKIIITIIVGVVVIFSITAISVVHMSNKESLIKFKSLRAECVNQKRMLIDKYEGDKMVSWECAGNPQ